MAKVLGLSFGYHDASASLVMDEKIVASISEERFTRQKHDASFPTHAVKYCLERGGLDISDIDRVVFHEDPQRKFSRVLTSSLSAFPHSRREFVNSVQTWLGQKLWTLNGISRRLNVDPQRIFHLNHHFSHAAQAFLGSGFDKSGVLIVDAVGEWASSSLFFAEWVEGQPRIHRLQDICFPHSLGLVYSAFTAFLGFRPNDGECSTMALAGFGQPRYVESIDAIVRTLEDSTYKVDQTFFNFDRFYQNAFSKRFTEVFGAPRTLRDKLPFSSLGAEPAKPVSEDQQRYADIACSVQRVFEERMLSLAHRLYRKVNCENLCLAGGAALNCVSNARLLRETQFRNFHIPPDPGDGGASLGAALYGATQAGDVGPQEICITNAYLGAEFKDRNEASMFAQVHPKRLRQHHKSDVQWREPKTWNSVAVEEASLLETVADALMQGKIVGWFQGRSEAGPRALGHRSILIRPDDVALAVRLSREVKERAAYRPYALSISQDFALRVLDIPEGLLHCHQWMQYSAMVRAEFHSRVRAAMHIDGTTRPQVCTSESDPRFYSLLKSFGARFGLPCVLNTSMNESGYPLCNTPVDALVMFSRTNMDILVINDRIYEKRFQ